MHVINICSLCPAAKTWIRCILREIPCQWGAKTIIRCILREIPCQWGVQSYLQYWDWFWVLFVSLHHYFCIFHIKHWSCLTPKKYLFSSLPPLVCSSWSYPVRNWYRDAKSEKLHRLVSIFETKNIKSK